ncbi:MAG: class I SAM-dependent methyltransferase [Phycisphaeraceae bacterium]
MEKYDQAFFDAHRAGARSSAQAVLPQLRELVKPTTIQSVIDIGCGSGTWLSVWRELDVMDLRGVDGAYVEQATLDIPAGTFTAHDLNQPIELDRTFDLAMSLEVAEHLKPERAASFVADLCRLSPLVLFSAAIPHQGGTDHINEQWPAYWAEHFHNVGYVLIDCLRLQLWDDPRIDYWYQQNLMLAVRHDRLAEYPLLQQGHDRMAGRVASLVHPQVLKRWVDWGMDQCNAYWQAVEKK